MNSFNLVQDDVFSIFNVQFKNPSIMVCKESDSSLSNYVNKPTDDLPVKNISMLLDLAGCSNFD